MTDKNDYDDSDQFEIMELKAKRSKTLRYIENHSEDAQYQPYKLGAAIITIIFITGSLAALYILWYIIYKL